MNLGCPASSFPRTCSRHNSGPWKPAPHRPTSDQSPREKLATGMTCCNMSAVACYRCHRSITYSCERVLHQDSVRAASNLTRTLLPLAVAQERCNTDIGLLYVRLGQVTTAQPHNPHTKAAGASISAGNPSSAHQYAAAPATQMPDMTAETGEFHRNCSLT